MERQVTCMDFIIVMTFVKNSLKIRENSLKFTKNWVKFANFKLQNEECHHYGFYV
jgi:hypothetical protein